MRSLVLISLLNLVLTIRYKLNIDSPLHAPKKQFKVERKNCLLNNVQCSSIVFLLQLIKYIGTVVL